MSVRRIVPDIRFTGFSGDWERRKFSEIIFASGEKNKDNLPYESYSITNEDGFVPQDEKFENGGTMKNADKRMYYIVSPKSFAYNPARINVGSIGYQDLGRDVIVSSLYEVFKTTNAVDDRFLWHWFKSDNFQKLVIQLQEGGVRLYFYYDKLCVGEIALPSVEEQHRIGAYFDAIDNSIVSLQRKLVALANFKKAMLDKMFPKEGAAVPEIRFNGFSGDWEQREVGDFYDFKNGLNKGKSFFGSGTPIVNFTDVFHKRGLRLAQLKGKVTLSPAEIANYEVRQGDIFFTRTSETIDEIGYPSVMLECPKDTVFSGFVLRGRAIGSDPLTLSFKQYAFTTKAFRAEMIKKSSMTTRALTSGTAIKRMLFQYPENTDEQNLIAAFFDNLDNLIVFHQSKLDCLRNIKEACLEKMFV